MKKFLFLLFGLLLCRVSFALPMGNPAEPMLYPAGILWGRVDGPCCTLSELFHIRGGYSGDFVFNRNLGVARPPLPQGHIVRLATIRRNAGFIALNFSDLIDVFATLGSTRIRFHANQQVYGTPPTFDSLLSLESHFSWSLGGRAVLMSWKCFTLGVEGEYFRTAPRVSTFYDFNGGVTAFFNTNNHTVFEEWQFGGGVSYTIQTWNPSYGFIPYVGIKWAHVRFDANNLQFITPGGESATIFNLNAHKRLGFVTGATLTFCDCIGLTAEGRFGDEKALYINGQICF